MENDCAIRVVPGTEERHLRISVENEIFLSVCVDYYYYYYYYFLLSVMSCIGITASKELGYFRTLVLRNCAVVVKTIMNMLLNISKADVGCDRYTC